MKHKISIIALLLGTGGLLATSSSNASAQGFYMGASAGYSALNTPSGTAFDVGTVGETLVMQTSSTSDTGGFGGGLFAGYNINKNFAVEVGYTSYANSNYDSEQTQYDEDNVSLGSNSSSIDYTTYSIDLFLKGTTEVVGQVSAFAKVGVSYVNQEVDYSSPSGIPSISVDNSNFATPNVGTSTYTALRPAGAIGLSYQATPHLSTAIFAQGFLGEGDFSTDKDAIASAYVVGASVTYDL